MKPYIDQGEVSLTATWLYYYYNVMMSFLLWNVDEAIGEHL